jgi:hypothetical protein
LIREPTEPQRYIIISAARVRTLSEKLTVRRCGGANRFSGEWVGRLHYGLSEIVDGKFVKPSTAEPFEFTPILVAHALGAALLDYLDDNSPLDHDTAERKLTEWLDSRSI